MPENVMANEDLSYTPFEVFDPRFKPLVNGTAKLERLYTGCRWAEGPAWFGAGRYLLWSDIPNNRIMRWDGTDGSVSVYRQPSNNTNGHTVDRQGRLISCEHLGRRVSRTEHDGSITILADRFEGKRFNSPNDVVVKSDNSIWFTDPAYGIDWDYEGEKAESEIGGCHVYRIAPDGTISRVADDFVRPNGLAFSPDESKLYIADTGATHMENGPRHIRVFDVVDGGKLRGGQIFATCTAGLFDGFRIDEDGRIWTSAGDGVHCYEPDRTLIGKIRVPEVVANVCFGEPRRNRLFICGTTSLYSYYTLVRGVKTY
jgi:gluconolactonase